MKTRSKSYSAALYIFLSFIILFSGFVILKERQGSNSPDWVNDPNLQNAASTVLAFAEEQGFSPEDYPYSLVALLERNPETKDFVLNYPAEHNKEHTIDLTSFSLETVPLFMQWDQRWGYLKYGDDLVAMNGCGPVCLAMAGYYCTGNASFSPDRMVEFAITNGYCVPGNGTAWTLISEGGERLGLDVTEIPLVKSRVMDNLEVGNPIICIMGPGDFTSEGHYIVMVGCENGLISINDPNSYARSEKLWDFDDIKDQIRNLWVIR